MDSAVAAAWAAVVVAFLAIVVTAFVAFVQARQTRRALEIAERQAAVAEAALPPPPPPVGWKVESAGVTPTGSPRWGLVNIGTDTAEDVEIDGSRAPSLIRAEKGSLPVRPHASIPLLSARSFGDPEFREIWVRWKGQPEWVPVPLPPDWF